MNPNRRLIKTEHYNATFTQEEVLLALNALYNLDIPCNLQATSMWFTKKNELHIDVAEGK